jgi:hypothetical protein
MSTRYFVLQSLLPSFPRSQPPMIAVGSDDATSSLSEKVILYEYSDAARRWMKVDAISVMSDPVHDIAFAPNIGRSYSVLAIASKELKMVTVKPMAANRGGTGVGGGGDDQASTEKYDVSQSVCTSWGSITLAFWMCSFDVRFTVKCVCNVIFEFLTLKNDIENAFDRETHIKTAQSKRKCNRPLKHVRYLEFHYSSSYSMIWGEKSISTWIAQKKVGLNRTCSTRIWAVCEPLHEMWTK